MKVRNLSFAMLVAAGPMLACTATVEGPEEASASSEAITTSCPTGASVDQQRAAATVAFNIMKAAAIACGGATAQPCWGTTILSSQRYHLAAGGATIEFDPADPLYSYVPNDAKVALAFGQLDAANAAFLVAGFKWAQQNTNGKVYAQIIPIAGLAQFTYPGNLTPVNIPDPMAGNNRRSVVMTGTPWCGTEKVHFVDTTSYENPFASMMTQQYTVFYGLVRPGYTGYNAWPSTPFNGSGGSNPFLVVSLNGSTVNWNSATWATLNCGGSTCSGTIDIDPVPYAEPGAYYDTSGNLVGTQANPFVISGTLYAVGAHAGQWATRTVNGIQEWGTFSTPTVMLGTTQYKYVKQM